MADLQILVERLEKAVGRLEMVSHSPGAHSGYGQASQNGKRHLAHQSFMYSRGMTLSLTHWLLAGSCQWLVSPPHTLGTPFLAFLKEATVLKWQWTIPITLMLPANGCGGMLTVSMICRSFRPSPTAAFLVLLQAFLCFPLQE